MYHHLSLSKIGKSDHIPGQHHLMMVGFKSSQVCARARVSTCIHACSRVRVCVLMRMHCTRKVF